MARYGPNGMGHRGQQDDRQDALQPAPGTECRQQFEIAVAHAFLAGQQLEQPPDRPKRQIAQRCADQGRLGRHVQVGDAAYQPQPHQGQGQLVRQQLGAQVDARQGDQEAGQHDGTEALPAEAELPDAGQHQQRGHGLHQRVLQRDGRLAVAALAALDDPAEQGDVLVPAQLVLA
ncbi:hypothetical protein G6F57_019647 [Rhizopus arrhizus]|nr:hypothetical protein G6F57_019647 [Rhizopus arrhizus]